MNAKAPSHDRDTPNVLITVAVALVCFGVGAALVLPLRHREDTVATEMVETAAPGTHAASPPDDKSAAQTIEATERVEPTTDKPAVPPPTEPTQTVEVVETPEETSNAPAETGLQLIPGRVAYLRCDGLRAEKAAAFPCPRDVALEGEAWAVLGTLPRCRPNLERGGVDVRLDIVRGKPTDVRVLPIAGSPEPTLDSERVYACVGKSLAKLNTRLDPIYMVVSLRASLR